MNRDLRRWHFRLLSVVAPAAVVTLAAAIAVRRAPPVNRVPAALAPYPPASGRIVDRRQIGEAGLSLELRLLKPPAGPMLVELTPLVEPHTADLLVYWSARAGGAALPADAVLLGPLSGLEPARYALPRDSYGAPGQLLLYTTAGSQVLGRIDLAPSESRP